MPCARSAAAVPTAWVCAVRWFTAPDGPSRSRQTQQRLPRAGVTHTDIRGPVRTPGTQEVF